MSRQESTYYEILGLNREATAPEIEAAFLRAQSRLSGAESAATVGTEYLAHAYEVLRDPQRRQMYDRLLGQLETAVVARVQASATELPLLNAPQIVYLLVELQPRAAAAQTRLPLNLCLVVDRSTSMREGRLRHVQTALTALIKKLAGGDTLALVSFSDRAEVVLPAAALARHEAPGQAIDALEASGGTEIYQGLLAGVAQLRLAAGPETNSQLILLTDGRTYGDQQQCLRLATQAAREGITFQAFGLGSDWDDEFLDALVAPSGGLSEHVASPEAIVETLTQRLQDLGETYASEVHLNTDLPTAVELLDAFRLTPFAQSLPVNDSTIPLGNVEGGSPLRFLLVLSIKPQPIAARIGIPLTFNAAFPGLGKQSFVEQVTLTVSENAAQTAVPPAVLQAARLLTLCRLNERAWQEAEAGEFASAAGRMQHLATRLLEADEPALARQAELQARQLTRTSQLSEERRKALKYGTRALTRNTLPLEWDE